MIIDRFGTLKRFRNSHIAEATINNIMQFICNLGINYPVALMVPKNSWIENKLIAHGYYCSQDHTALNRGGCTYILMQKGTSST